MIFQGNYTDNTKQLARDFDRRMNEKNLELQQARTELGSVNARLFAVQAELKSSKDELAALSGLSAQKAQEAET